MDQFQFYSTPAWLAKKAWAMFKNQDFKRVLEPAAGTGALALPGLPEQRGLYRRNGPQIDVIELDVTKHAVLREAGLNVVGLDFLQFESGACYSTVIGNPPFSQGSAFVLKAWDMLWAGEIVMILNAETVRNPFSAERRRVVELIEKHGSVEFIKDAFKGPDVQREANVEIALIHLTKPATDAADWIRPMIDALAVEPDDKTDYRLPNELMLPQSFVQTQVAAFRAAVRAAREAVRAELVADYYGARIGATMAEHNQGKEKTSHKTPSGESIRAAIAARHDALKDRAWASVLRSTETLSRLSSKVQKQVEAEFEKIKLLEFNETNVLGFLCGLVENQGQMQIDMAVDVFLQITRYWSENTVFYKGWRSNDAHRSCGWRLKTTRFILPGFGVESYSRDLSWDMTRRLADFDMVFAMLDGKRLQRRGALNHAFAGEEDTAPVGIVDLFNKHFDELKAGERVSGTYFDVRYYRQAGTVHFFARSKQLVDRLNRLVGRHRGWLPPDDGASAETFWKVYEAAEKLDTELQSALRSQMPGASRHAARWDHPARALLNGREDDFEQASERMLKALDTVLERRGLLTALTREQEAARLAEQAVNAAHSGQALTLAHCPGPASGPEDADTLRPAVRPHDQLHLVDD